MGEAFLMNKSGSGVDPDLTLKNVYCVEDVDDIVDCSMIPIIGSNNTGYTINGCLPLTHGWWAWTGYDWYESVSNQGYFNYSGGLMPKNINSSSNSMKYQNKDNGLIYTAFGSYSTHSMDIWSSNVKIKDNDYLITSYNSTSSSSSATRYLYRIQYTVIDENTAPTYTRTSVDLGSAWNCRIGKLSNDRVIVFTQTSYENIIWKIFNYDISSTTAAAPTQVSTGSFTIQGSWNSHAWGIMPIDNDKFVLYERKAYIYDYDDEGDALYKHKLIFRIVSVSDSNEITLTNGVEHSADDGYLDNVYIPWWLPVYKQNEYSILLGYSYSNISKKCIIVCVNNTTNNLTINTEIIEPLYFKTLIPVPNKTNCFWGLGGKGAKEALLINLTFSIVSEIASVSYETVSYKLNASWGYTVSGSDGSPQFIGQSVSYNWNYIPNGWYDIYALKQGKLWILFHGADELGYYDYFNDEGSNWYYKSGAFCPCTVYEVDYFSSNSLNSLMNAESVLGKVTGSEGSVVKGKFLLKTK